ncbi:MAG: DUF4139 domain-containing protein [bacterium]
MIKRTLILALTGILIIISELTVFSTTTQMKTTEGDRQILNITAYNNNLALVNDIREITLPLGTIKLHFKDVAKQIDPSSIFLSFPSNLGTINILEQDFDTDSIKPSTLLERYIGKDIKLAETNVKTGEEKIITARLLSADPKPIFLINNEIHLDHPGRVILPDMPKGLGIEPTLAFLLDCQSEGAYNLEISYLTKGLTWDAYYIFYLNNDEIRGDLMGWVTITNNSGSSYENANCKLIAGDIHRAKEKRTGIQRKRERNILEEEKDAFVEEEFFDYHLYTLPRKITLKNNQSKQIQLLNASRIPVKKEYRDYGGQYYAGANSMKKAPVFAHAGVYLELENKTAHNLGIPLPGGIIRIYKKSNEADIQFLGEDTMSHISENQRVEIEIGKAFDITTTRLQTDWQKISKNQFEIAWEINISNQKTEAVAVKIFEPVPADWEIVQSNQDWTKIRAHLVEFNSVIPPKMTEKISYRVSVKY